MEQLLANYYLTKAISLTNLITENESEEGVVDGNTVTWNMEKSAENIKNTSDVKQYFNLVKNKIKNLAPDKKKKLAKTAIIAALIVLSKLAGEDPKSLELDYSGVLNDDSQTRTIINIADDSFKDAGVDVNTLVKIKPSDKVDNKDNSTKVAKGKFVRPRNTEMSPEILKHLKEYEGFRRTAYDLGDGAKTIGYGHAIFKDASKSNNKKKYSFLPNYENVIVGKTSITDEQAEQLLIDDYNEARTQLDAIFNKWEAQGIPFYITQEMYDSMISLIFNRGIGAFRNSDFIQLIKKGPEYYAKAADTIKDMSSQNFKKFPGLKKRRKSEANMFIKGYKELKNKVFKKLGL